jgi:putative lipoic acid-binding regulatory protein
MMNNLKSDMTTQDSLIEYPCDFPIKVFGIAQSGFAQAIAEVVLAHDPDFKSATIETRSSSNAKYLSLTCTIRATSREQLDNLYRDLTSHPMVKMVL